MDGFAYYNGTYAPASEIHIPLTDRALYFGDGIYEAAVGRGDTIFLEEEHLARFFGNLRRLDLPLGMSGGELCRILHRVTARAEGYFFLYFQLTRYSERRVHDYPDTGRSNLLVTVNPYTPPEKNATLALITQPDLRHRYCDIKTLNLLPAVMASHRAGTRGADEAVFHRGRTVTECAHSNIAILRDGVLLTHPEGPLILPGTERRRLLLACDALGIPCREVPFTLRQLREADEILITSTSKLCQRAAILDGVPVGMRDPERAQALAGRLREEFFAAVSDTRE